MVQGLLLREHRIRHRRRLLHGGHQQCREARLWADKPHRLLVAFHAHGFEHDDDRNVLPVQQGDQLSPKDSSYHGVS